MDRRAWIGFTVVGLASCLLMSVAVGAEVAPEVRSAARDLGSRDPVVRGRAASRLGDMGPAAAPAVPVLVQLLSDESEVFAASLAVGRVAFGQNTTVSDVAAKALGRIGDKRAVPALCVLMLNPSRQVNWLARKSAAESLGEIGDPRAVSPLMQALLDFMIDDAAEESLVRIGEPAVKALVTLAKTGPPKLRPTAFGMLGKIGKPAVPSLVTLMRSGSPETRRLAACALGKTHEPEALDILCAALNDPKVGSPTDAVAGLKDFCTHRPPGKNSLDDELQKAFASALQGEAITPVVTIFKNKATEAEVRRCAGEVLVQSRNPRIVEALAQALTDPDQRTRSEAFSRISLLTMWAHTSRPWFNIQDPTEMQQWDQVRSELLQALRSKATAELAKALDSKDPHERTSAQNSLRDLTGKDLNTRAEAETWLKQQEGN